MIVIVLSDQSVLFQSPSLEKSPYVSNLRESSKVLARKVTKYIFLNLTALVAVQRIFSLSSLRREKCGASVDLLPHAVFLFLW